VATGLQSAQVSQVERSRAAGLERGAIALAPVSVALAVGATAVSAEQLLAAVLVLVWAAAGAAMVGLRSGERLGTLVLVASTLAGAATLAAALLEDDPGRDVATLVRALALALLPAVGLHVLLGLPDGFLVTQVRRVTVLAGCGGAVVIGLGLWTARPSLPVWPLAVEGVVAAAVGLAGGHARYRTAGGLERQRMQWVGWAIAAAVEISLVAIALRVLAGWPDQEARIAAVATTPIPIALAVGGSRRLGGWIDRLLVHTIAVLGLTGVVVAVYFVIVLGLGRVPNDEEQTLLLLSMAAAAIAALLYLPARNRLERYATRLVYGEREAPDAVLRTFGSRLSRAIPLDELLLQLAESLQKTLALSAAEVWTGSSGAFERVVSVPERGRAQLVLSAAEEPVVARAGVSGPAWLKIWLPQLLTGREEAVVRTAPIVHSGELFGLIVAERPAEGELFTEADEQALGELARQVGLALRNVRLDSALQASLEELRNQAGELQASRARVVAAADAERRRIERDLHDGAQQHLVALAVNLRLARQLGESDPAAANAMLEELGTAVQDALQELRDLAHGIYPPLLLDRGLAEALVAAANRAPVPAKVEAGSIGRYRPEVEATIYFCCLEALQNAGKYAGEGARATLRVWEEEGGLLFEVVDDGAGFNLEGQPKGAGFTNMGDRLGAIGGSLRVESSPGAGTRVSGAVPLPS
jgi:signal transduction histidine kinase